MWYLHLCAGANDGDPVGASTLNGGETDPAAVIQLY